MTAKIERGEYTFVVKEGEKGKPSILAEPTSMLLAIDGALLALTSSPARDLETANELHRTVKCASTSPASTSLSKTPCEALQLGARPRRAETFPNVRETLATPQCKPKCRPKNGNPPQPFGNGQVGTERVRIGAHGTVTRTTVFETVPFDLLWHRVDRVTAGQWLWPRHAQMEPLRLPANRECLARTHPCESIMFRLR